MKDKMEKFCVTVNSKEDLALLVHRPNRIVKFNQFSNGLYVMNLINENSFILTNKRYQFLKTSKRKIKVYKSDTTKAIKTISRALQSNGNSHNG